MNRATRSHPLNKKEKHRNKRITRKRAPGEQPYAVIKNIFHNGHVKVTTTLRTHTKNIFTCICYNLLQLNTLKQKKHNLANANKKNMNIKQKETKKIRYLVNKQQKKSQKT